MIDLNFRFTEVELAEGEVRHFLLSVPHGKENKYKKVTLMDMAEYILSQAKK